MGKKRLMLKGMKVIRGKRERKSGTQKLKQDVELEKRERERESNRGEDRINET